MAAIGSPVTTKFHIGEGEIRIGTVSNANKLTQANSMGLLQGATVAFAQETVDLEAGLPKRLVDTAVTRQTVTISAQAYEYSRKNIQVMLGEGVSATAPVEHEGVVQLTEPAGGTGTGTIQTDIAYNAGTQFIGDLWAVYDALTPGDVSIIRATAVADDGGGDLDISYDRDDTPLLFQATGGTSLIYRANQVGVGASTTTQYFTVDILGLERSTGKPVGFKFWKASIDSGLEYAFAADNFAVTPVSFKVLAPATSEYGVGEPYEHLAAVIPAHPYGIFWNG